MPMVNLVPLWRNNGKQMHMIRTVFITHRLLFEPNYCYRKMLCHIKDFRVIIIDSINFLPFEVVDYDKNTY